MKALLRNIIQFPFYSTEWARFIFKKFEKRSNRRDWFTIINAMAKITTKEGRYGKEFEWLDIGAGECHSTIQQLNAIQKNTNTKIMFDIDVDVLEPSSYGLAHCLFRLHKIKKGVVFRNFFKAGWHDVKLPFRYDLITAVHSAYYFTEKESDFRKLLKKIWLKLKKGGVAELLILPSYSCFYKVIGKNYFGDWVYAENIVKILESFGYKPKFQEFSMKLNINNVFKYKNALTDFWLFVMNKGKMRLDPKEEKRFIEVLKSVRFKHNKKWVIEMNDWLIWFKK